jgi:hypothetical protein
MRIIAERDAGHLSAWRKDDPATALGGSDAAMTDKRLCNALDLDVTSIAVDRAGCRTDHLEFVVGAPCPECGGSGRYVGLNAVEGCGTCGGVGRVI